nr:MAG TPA: hypothetical protein [Caudoviricetes sp.]
MPEKHSHFHVLEISQIGELTAPPLDCTIGDN